MITFDNKLILFYNLIRQEHQSKTLQELRDKFDKLLQSRSDIFTKIIEKIVNMIKFYYK